MTIGYPQSKHKRNNTHQTRINTGDCDNTLKKIAAHSTFLGVDSQPLSAYLSLTMSSAAICPVSDVSGDDQTTTGPNWELAKALYLSGMGNEQVSQRANVPKAGLLKRIVRERWSALKADSRSIASQAVVTVTTTTKPKDLNDSVENGSQTARTRLARRLELHTAVVERSRPPTTLKGVIRETEALRPLIDNCRVIYGWSDSTTTTAISIRDLYHPAQWVEPKAIDVQATPDPQPIVVDTPGVVEARD